MLQNDKKNILSKLLTLRRRAHFSYYCVTIIGSTIHGDAVV